MIASHVAKTVRARTRCLRTCHQRRRHAHANPDRSARLQPRTEPPGAVAADAAIVATLAAAAVAAAAAAAAVVVCAAAVAVAAAAAAESAAVVARAHALRQRHSTCAQKMGENTAHPTLVTCCAQR